VLLIGSCVQLVLRLLSWGHLHPDVGQMAYGFAFYILSLFLTVGTRARPDHLPFLLYNLAFHGCFVVAGVLLFQPRLPGVWLSSALSCWALVYVARYGFAVVRGRAVAALFGPQVQGSEPLVQRCFFVQTPVYHALLLGLGLGTVYGTFLRASATPLAWHAVAGVFAALALAELRGLSAGFHRLASDLATPHAQPHVQLDVDTSFDGGQLRVRAPREATLSRVAAEVRGLHVLGQLERMMVATLCALVVWRLELPTLPAELLGGALLVASLLAAPLPYLIGQRTSNAHLGKVSNEPRIETRSTLLGPGKWATLVGALLLGALAFLCLTPLLADAHP